MFKKNDICFETTDRVEFETYLLTEHRDVAREVEAFGIRYDLADDNPDPLTELITQIVNGEYEDMAEGDLINQGMKYLEMDQVEFGGNLDENYYWNGIRIEG